jgi:H+-transporting ATPase
LLVSYKIIAFKPFDPVSKMTEATVVDTAGNKFTVTKGAPQVISSLVDSNQISKTKLDEYINKFAVKGYRALGVARTDAQGKWRFAGLLALYDPPREDSAETIKTAQSMGIDVKMITGDHLAIAKEISRQVNLNPDIMLATSFHESCLIEKQRKLSKPQMVLLRYSRNISIVSWNYCNT